MPKIRFTNAGSHDSHKITDILKWKLGIGDSEPSWKSGVPDSPAGWKRIDPEQIREIPEKSWRVAWLGHASFLIQGFGASLLIDPIFSDYCSPFPLYGLRRKVPPPLAMSDLPAIDGVLLTHSHYDHLDLPTLRKLPGQPRIVIAEGHAQWLQKKLTHPVSELPWYGTMALTQEIKITSTPAQHFSARTPFDRNRGHWCGWILEAEGSKLWHAGDSGYCAVFREIGERYGPMDFGMIPIGAYQPRRIMKPVHMNPEEALQAFLDTRCQTAVGMHWGTFSLTDEPMQEPPLRLEAEIKRVGLVPNRFTTCDVGSIWEI